MTVGDFIKRVAPEDLDKMMILTDGDGWSNLNIEIKADKVEVTPDRNEIFSDDKG